MRSVRLLGGLVLALGLGALIGGCGGGGGSGGSKAIGGGSGSGTGGLGTPVITAVTPTAGIPGDLVTIEGQGFALGRSVVRFGNEVAFVQQSAPDRIVAVVPNMAAGQTIVSVDVAAQVSNGVAFTVQAPPSTGAPVLSALVPASARPGERVEIQGLRLGGVVSAEVGGMSVSVSSSGGALGFNVPALNPGSVQVVVIDAAGNRSNPLSLQVLAPASISRSGVRTAGGPMRGGLIVRVHDEVSGRVLGGASVVVETAGARLEAQTNPLGEARFSVSGPATVTCGLAGYALLSLVDVDAAEIDAALEPLATNRVVSGTIAFPASAPPVPAALQWQAAVSASEQPRFSRLRAPSAPFNEPTSGGSATQSQLAFQIEVYEGRPFSLTFSLAANQFDPTSNNIQIQAWQVLVQQHSAIFTDMALPAQVNFSQSAGGGVQRNVDELTLGSGTHGTLASAAPPLGVSGSDTISSRVNARYPGAKSPAAVGLWAWSPFSSAQGAVDAYFYNDGTSPLEVITAAFGTTGSGLSLVQRVSADARALDPTSPTMPQAVALMAAPSITQPAPGAVNVGAFPQVAWNDNGALQGGGGFYELLLDQIVGGSVRAWRLLVPAGTSRIALPTLPQGLSALALQRGLPAGDQVRMRLTVVRVGVGFDFDQADFAATLRGPRQFARTVIGFSP